MESVLSVLSARGCRHSRPGPCPGRASRVWPDCGPLRRGSGHGPQALARGEERQTVYAALESVLPHKEQAPGRRNEMFGHSDHPKCVFFEVVWSLADYAPRSGLVISSESGWKI
jgi:hypothetical protein